MAGNARKYDRTSICFRCEKMFERYPGKQKGQRSFCSKECRTAQMGEDNRSKRVNQKGGLTLEEREKIRNWQLENPTKDRNNFKTYEKKFGRHEHRSVMEQMIGRPLKDGEVVHHIDLNPRNNNPENLMLFSSQAEHLAWHRENDPRYGGDASHD